MIDIDMYLQVRGASTTLQSHARAFPPLSNRCFSGRVDWPKLEQCYLGISANTCSCVLASTSNLETCSSIPKNHPMLPRYSFHGVGASTAPVHVYAIPKYSYFMGTAHRSGGQPNSLIMQRGLGRCPRSKRNSLSETT